MPKYYMRGAMPKKEETNKAIAESQSPTKGPNIYENTIIETTV